MDKIVVRWVSTDNAEVWSTQYARKNVLDVSQERMCGGESEMFKFNTEVPFCKLQPGWLAWSR